MVIVIYCLFILSSSCKKSTENAKVKLSKIIYLAGTGEHRDLFILNEDGSDKRQLTQDIPIGDAFHSFSPDGSRLVFTSGSEGNPTAIYVINLDGSGLKKIVDGESANWSPYFDEF